MKILYVNLTLGPQQITKPAEQQTNITATAVSTIEYGQHSKPRYSVLQSKHSKATVLTTKYLQAKVLVPKVQISNSKQYLRLVSVSKETERATQPEVMARGTKMYLKEGSDTVKR